MQLSVINHKTHQSREWPVFIPFLSGSVSWWELWVSTLPICVAIWVREKIKSLVDLIEKLRMLLHIFSSLPAREDALNISNSLLLLLLSLLSMCTLYVNIPQRRPFYFRLELQQNRAQSAVIIAGFALCGRFVGGTVGRCSAVCFVFPWKLWKRELVSDWIHSSGQERVTLRNPNLTLIKKGFSKNVFLKI